MIPYDYGFGYEPNSYTRIEMNAYLMKQFGCSCKAIAKKVSRKFQRKMK